MDDHEWHVTVRCSLHWPPDPKCRLCTLILPESIESARHRRSVGFGLCPECGDPYVPGMGCTCRRAGPKVPPEPLERDSKKRGPS